MVDYLAGGETDRAATWCNKMAGGNVVQLYGGEQCNERWPAP
jgi:hypothetical protein